MRDNQPVSKTEYHLRAGDSLVSVTDLKGRIVYCNPAFVEASGFALAELLGQPHNIVRHPDMPAEAFRDLWDTLQQGLPWTGLVKNRRKNGDFYWVQASATPITRDGVVKGFLSVRTAPAPAACAQAERLYAAMRADQAQGRRRHVFQRGSVLGTSWPSRLRRALRPGLRGAQFALPAMIGVLTAAAATFHPLAGAATCLLLSCAFAVWSAHLIEKPLRDLIAEANLLAAGDLAHQGSAEGHGLAGELRRALAQVRVNLRTVVGDTRQAVRVVSLASTDITAGNDDISERTESQASSLQQTAASMRQIHSSVRSTAEAAQQGSALAAAMRTEAHRSRAAVHEMVATMAAISASSRRVAEITGLIEGIAFQTNILALNAAVEAARAGAAGRGFNVVAGEVRTLAQRTAQAVGEIKQLVGASTAQVAAGNRQSQAALAEVDGTLAAIERVHGLLNDISHSATEQETGIGQVDDAVTSLDRATAQSTILVEQLASVARSLNDQVAAVLDSMSLFRVEPRDHSICERDAVELRKQARLAA